MSGKMFVICPDKAQGDPVSKLMCQLAEQLDRSTCCGAKPVCFPPEVFCLPEPGCCPPKPPGCCDMPLNCQPLPACIKQTPTEICVSPPTAKQVKTAITAETTIDCFGQAKAQVFVNTDQDPLCCAKPCVMPCPTPCIMPPCPPASPNCVIMQKCPEVVACPAACPPTVCDEGPACSSQCERRNGLDQDSRKKFEYVGGNCCPRRLGVKELLMQQSSASNSGTKSCSSPTPAVVLRECPKNIPDARLMKYRTCVNRRNGLQDKCDSVTHRALKNCRRVCN